MNGVLIETFRHNAWATRKLLEFCNDLSEEQLSTSGTGSYGTILDTFSHIVWSEGSYLRRLSGVEPEWHTEYEAVNLSTLIEHVENNLNGWEQLLSQPVDAEHVLQVDEGEYEVRTGVIITQALHHGNHHREQICAMLTGLGLQPPDVQAWEYAWDTGRIWKTTN